MTKAESEKGGPSLPTTGLAADLVPLLRKHLASRDSEPSQSERSSKAATALLEFADAALGDSPVDENAAPERTRQFVTFVVGAADYALPIECVQEVLRVGPITRVPQAPEHVRGVTNVRGRVLPVLELSSRLGGTPIELSKDSRIVTVEVEGRLLALLVDRASNVVSMADSAIEPAPDDVVSADASYIVGVGRFGAKVIILLDLERVLAPAT